MKAFKCQVEFENKIPVINVQGFLDMSKLESFEKILDEICRGGYPQCVLDFSKLEYINSASLGVVIAKIREIRSRSGDIRVGGCSPLVADILGTFGFTDIFKIYTNRHEALQSFVDKP